MSDVTISESQYLHWQTIESRCKQLTADRDRFREVVRTSLSAWEMLADYEGLNESLNQRIDEHRNALTESEASDVRQTRRIDWVVRSGESEASDD